MRLDSDAEELAEIENNGAKKMKYSIDGVEFEVSEELYNALMAKDKKADEMIAELKKAETDMKEKEKMDTAELDKIKVELKSEKETKEQIQAKLDAAELSLKERNDSKLIEEAVKTRLSLEKNAAKFLGETKLDGKSNLEIMVEAIKAQSPNADMTEKSETYIQARFDAICELHVSRGNESKDLGKKILTAKNDSALPDVDAARKKQREETLNAHKADLAFKKK